MGYVIEAVLTRLDGRPLSDIAGPYGRALLLRDGDDLALIPMTELLRATLSGGSGEPILGFHDLTNGIACWASALSIGRRTAYVHAEFFGGTGFQSAVGWLGGEVQLGPTHTKNHPAEADARYVLVPPRHSMAIDHALTWLGVGRGDARDEFDAVGLGRFRRTEEWFPQAT